MNRRHILSGLGASSALGLLHMGGCSNLEALTQSVGWISLLDGVKGFEQWRTLGNANWSKGNGYIQADKGSGFLVSAASYDNFMLRVEFWADENANSGIFMRMSDQEKINAANSYEVNIYDKRPGQEYSTGAIVDVAKLNGVPPKAANRWNVFEITAQGSELTVRLNGLETVRVNHNKFKSGPFALQYAPGVVKDAGIIRFRKVDIRVL
jgi:hypothetical protein